MGKQENSVDIFKLAMKDHTRNWTVLRQTRPNDTTTIWRVRAKSGRVDQKSGDGTSFPDCGTVWNEAVQTNAPHRTPAHIYHSSAFLQTFLIILKIFCISASRLTETYRPPRAKSSNTFFRHLPLSSKSQTSSIGKFSSARWHIPSNASQLRSSRYPQLRMNVHNLFPYLINSGSNR